MGVAGVRKALVETYWGLQGIREQHGPPPEIRTAWGTVATPVDEYWGQHTVRFKLFRSTKQSLSYLEWRFAEYPLFRETMQLYGKHADEIILDYGCGPGNDVTGFAVYSQARKIIGMDVSHKALSLTSRRLALHCVPLDRIQLIQVGDTECHIPLETESVDHIHSCGVLHHTSMPDQILREFHRVLKPGGTSGIMVYNQDSLYLHLLVAYWLQIVRGLWSDLDTREAFVRSTDGEDCPISRYYHYTEWSSLCTEAGFEVEYMGSYLSKAELQCLKGFSAQAVQDARLATEHKEFLQKLSFDANGFPMYDGYHAGIGGVYRLRKR